MTDLRLAMELEEALLDLEEQRLEDFVQAEKDGDDFEYEVEPPSWDFDNYEKGFAEQVRLWNRWNGTEE